MKHFVFAAALAAAAFAATAPVSAQVGLSINVGEPNFYGRIDLGDAPPPRLVYRRPVVVEGEVGGRDPVYLHVRPGYERNWRSHCGEYNACGQPVLFVRDDWYRVFTTQILSERGADGSAPMPCAANDRDLGA